MLDWLKTFSTALRGIKTPLFGATKQPPVRTAQTDNLRNWQKAVSAFHELYLQREKLSAVEIIAKLQRIHELNGLPLFMEDTQRMSLAFQIMEQLRALEIPQNQAASLAEMLEWKEGNNRGYGSDYLLAIVGCLEKVASQKITPHLKRFLQKLQKLKTEEGRGSHRFTTLAEVERRMKQILANYPDMA